jgi:hypothetical protein
MSNPASGRTSNDDNNDSKSKSRKVNAPFRGDCCVITNEWSMLYQSADAISVTMIYNAAITATSLEHSTLVCVIQLIILFGLHL